MICGIVCGLGSDCHKMKHTQSQFSFGLFMDLFVQRESALGYAF